ncbi:uncharacterized protein LOC134223292 [Armigeres subalbatus]|uniref:uncharacterized protein LOC134223292 n=1 Tax=Armigeres subalbatus TaxID=124917 RepID=UPI002ED10B5D
MTGKEYDLKANRIASKRCSARAALITILTIVILAAIVGSLLYYLQLWPSPEKVDPPRRNLTIAFIKHAENQFLVAPGTSGNPFGAVFNESDRDVSPLDTTVRQIASYEFRMHLKPGKNRRIDDGEKIVPIDTEGIMWSAPVGKWFVVKLTYDGKRITLDDVLEVRTARLGEHPDYDALFETLTKVENMLPESAKAKAQEDVIGLDRYDVV